MERKADVRRTRTSRRRILLLISILTAVTYGGWAGAQFWACRRVTARLEELNGGPVHIDQIAIRLRSLTLRGVELFEPSSHTTRWCIIDRIWMDLSLWDGLRGKTTSDRMAIYEPSLRLRFSEDGKLLTRLRSAEGGIEPPARDTRVSNAAVQIDVASRSPYVIQGIHCDAVHRDGQLSVEGQLAGFLNTDWQFDASLDTKTPALSAELSADDLRVSESDFASLPFLGAHAKRLPRASIIGRGAATVQWDANGLEYDATFAPSILRVTLWNGEFESIIESGLVVAKNSLFSISNVQGRLFGGEFCNRWQTRFRANDRHG